MKTNNSQFSLYSSNINKADYAVHLKVWIWVKREESSRCRGDIQNCYGMKLPHLTVDKRCVAHRYYIYIFNIFNIFHKLFLF